MNHVRIELHFTIGFHNHIVGIAAQVVAGEVDQHHMFGIFFWVLAQSFGQFAVLFIVSGAFKSSGNGVNVSFVVFDAELSFGARPKNAVSSVIEIKKIRRRIDGTQRAVHIKIITFVFLCKLAAQHNLEYIAAVAVLLAFGYHVFIFVVGNVRSLIAHRFEFGR